MDAQVSLLLMTKLYLIIVVTVIVELITMRRALKWRIYVIAILVGILGIIIGVELCKTFL